MVSVRSMMYFSLLLCVCLCVYTYNRSTHKYMVISKIENLSFEIIFHWVCSHSRLTLFKFEVIIDDEGKKGFKIIRWGLSWWFRIWDSPMQGTRVWSLVQEVPTCHGASKPVCHNCWAREPQLLSLCATTAEAYAPRAHALQQEKPLPCGAWAPQQRVALACCS